MTKSFLEPNSSMETLAFSNFNFAAAGDWGCNSNAKKTVEAMVSRDPEIVLGLGDYSYNITADCWLKITNPLTEKMKIAIGNHEHISSPSRYFGLNTSYLVKEYLSHFNLTKEYYSFTFQNVHFAVMSTEVPFRVGSKQFDFIKNDLESASANSSINWIVVIFHQAVYTSPTVILPNVPNILFRDIYHPLFDKYGVDLVLQGHIHNYQRTNPLIFNSANSSRPIVTALEKTYYHNPRGTIFVIVGTGGESLYGLRGTSYFTTKQLSRFGFLDIDMANNGLTMNATFYGNGKVQDHFIINK